jgi:hypothetical protein
MAAVPYPNYGGGGTSAASGGAGGSYGYSAMSQPHQHGQQQGLYNNPQSQSQRPYQQMTGDIKEGTDRILSLVSLFIALYCLDLCTLFVHYLPPHVKDNDLYQLFSPFGTVLKSNVKLDMATQQSRCFGKLISAWSCVKYFYNSI